MSARGLGRVALLALALACLVAAVMGGLARLGLAYVPAATAAHGALMIGGFLGTVIALERAVALGASWGYAAPAAAGAGGVAIALGHALPGAALMIVAPLLFTAASVAIARRQAQLHTAILVAAALAWLAGNALWIAGRIEPATAWWFAFLVLTIAAERLEMTRLMPRRAAARPLFLAAAALLPAGALATSIDATVGAIVFGTGLAALAAWLAAFDIARRTVRTQGFSRYCALALLGGYAWLAAAGMAWAAARAGAPALRDLALHGLGLGFVVSMIFAHAPLVVPVIARARMGYTPLFYAPLALLHVSLLVRLAAGAQDPALRLAGGVLNAAAFVAFAATLAYSMARAR